MSHASTDVAATEMVYHWLVDDEHEVFLDQQPHAGIAPGDEWDRRLHERLRWADAVVCVLTSSFARSTWCAAEVALARSRGALVVPVVAEAGVRHPLLADLQAIYVTRDPQDARQRLAGRLVSLYGSPLAVPDDLEPFPGLLPFEADRHRLFFGREAEVQRLVEALRSPAERADGALFVLVGPSGCGKSSLVRAGLLPTVAQDPDQFSLAPVVPGPDPAGNVCVELAEAGTRRLRLQGWSIEEVRRRVAAHGLSRLVDELLLAVPGPRRRRVILVVDQFEELLTRTSIEARADFAELVGPALAGSLQVVATLRPEFLDPLLTDPELASLPKRIHTLEPMNLAALRSVIEKPAEVAGIQLADGLADLLVTDTGSGEALPLLAYTLAQLAEGVKRGGLLTLARYDQLGGVQGTLTAQADDALTEAVDNGGRDRAAVIRSLMRLIHVDEQGRPARIRVPLAELPPQVVAELDPFLKHRLLSTATETTGRSDAHPQDGRVVIGVAHEAFLTAWPPLHDAIRRDPVAFRAQRMLQQAAAQWSAGGHHRRHLWSGSQLSSAAADLGAQLRWATLRTDRAELDSAAAQFLRASMLRSRRLRQGLIAGLSVLTLAMTIIGGIALWQRDIADEQRRIAVARQLLTQADAARDSDVRGALMLGVAAHRLAPGPEADANILETLTSTAYSRTLASDVPVVTIAVSPDGLMLAEGGIDGRATLWDISDPLLPRRLGSPLTAQRGYVYDLEFSPDGRLLAAAGADRTVALWDMTDPAAPRPLGDALPEHRDVVHAVAFSPDGQALAAVDFAGRLVMRDITDPAAPEIVSDTPTGHRGEVVDVAFAPDRPLLATASLDHTVRLWDVIDRTRPAAVGEPLVGQDHPVWAVAFAPGGQVLASADADGYLTQWDVGPEGAAPLGTPVRAHTGAAYALAYSPDGMKIATVGADRAVRQWSTSDPAAPQPVGDRLTGHTDQVYSVAYARGGTTLATGSADRTTVLWDLTSPSRAVPVGPPLVRDPSPSLATAISPDRRWLAAGGQGRVIAMWDVSDPARPHPRPDPLTPSRAVRALAFSPTAPVLAATTADGSLALWDTTGSGPPRLLGTATVASGPASALAFAPDGQRIAVAGHDRSVSLWDVTDPARPERIGNVATDHTGPVHAVAFAPDGRRLASGAADGSVMLWDVSGPAGPRWIRPTLVGGGAPKFSVAFSPNGRRLAATGTDGSTLLFEVSPGGEPVRDGTPLPADGGPMYTIAFSPDSSLLVGGGRAGSISIWEVSQVRKARSLGHPLPAAIGSINALAFAPGATWLAASGGTGGTAIWDLAGFRELRVHAVERACATTGRGMTPQEWASLIQGISYQDSCAPD